VPSEKQALSQELSKLTAEQRQQQKQAIFGVGGMACAFCASTIEQGLSQIKGIDSAKVIMNTSEVVVRYDPSRINRNSIKKHLMGLGYHAFEETEKLGADQRVVEDNKRRTLAAAAITAPIAIIAYLSSMLGLFDFGLTFKLIEMVASGVVLFYFGLPIHIGAFNGLRRGILNEHVLYGAAGFAAYAVGLISLFHPTAVNFFNAASLLTTFHLAAGWYGAKVRSDTTKALRKILDLQPPTARIVRDQHEVIVTIDEVKADDLVKIRGGEKIPVDGIIESGESTVSEAILTGESEPVHKRKGDSVLAGSTNGDGLLIIRTERVGSETMLMRVAGNVKQIQESKPLLLTIFDKVIDKYVMAVLALAVLTAVGWAVYNIVTGADLRFTTIYASLAVLVIGYPCAIGLSTPPVKLRAISIGADKGVLINDASALFLMPRADTIVLDKTGTITEGKPKVNAIVTFNGISEQELIKHAASIKQGSSHPIARAIVEEAQTSRITLLPSDTKQITGKGAMGSIDGRQVIIGNQAFIEEHRIGITKEQLQRIKTIDSPVFVAVDKKLEGVLGVSDTIRLGIDSTINRLKQAGFDIFMLTGDTKAAAEKVASQLGIQFEARMSPMQKAEYIKKLQSEKQRRTVIAVGDGVNDAPALAQSDVGMAVGSGIDISKETASFVLLTDDIAVIPALVRLGKKFGSTVKRNIILALAFNAAGIPIAGMGYLNPFVAMTIMIVDVAVVFASTWMMTGGGSRENIVIERKEQAKPSKHDDAPSIIAREERSY
jgi:heavy metal translocating P-type ATPase